MSGTLQLFTHMTLAGISLGLGITVFTDARIVVMIFASLFWLVAYFHFAEAAWIPSWGGGHDWVDRVGIATKGVGFTMMSACVLLSPSIVSVLIGFVGLIVAMFGRILWEMMNID